MRDFNIEIRGLTYRFKGKAVDIKDEKAGNESEIV